MSGAAPSTITQKTYDSTAEARKMILVTIDGTAYSIEPVIEQKTGADCTGGNGASDRTLTLTNTRLTTGNSLAVYVEGVRLTNGAGKDFTVSHKAASSVITFLNSLLNVHKIIVEYKQ